MDKRLFFQLQVSAGPGQIVGACLERVGLAPTEEHAASRRAARLQRLLVFDARDAGGGDGDVADGCDRVALRLQRRLHHLAFGGGAGGRVREEVVVQ